MARVLVTGASGFVGGHLAESLVHRGENVRCLVRSTSKIEHLKSLGVELACGDLSEGADWRPILEGIDIVYHVAGKTCALKSHELIQVNGHGTFQLARACAKRLSPPTFLLMSSLAAAGTSQSGTTRRECDVPRPISDYGRSKRAGERAAKAWAGRIPVTIVRPGIVFGPRNRDMLPIFRSVFRMRVHAVPGFRASRVSSIHVDDLTEITVRAAQQGVRVPAARSPGEFSGQGYYFACTAEQPTYAELGRVIGRAVGRQNILLLHLPGPIPWMAAAGNQLVSRLRGKADTFNLDKMREATAGAWVGTDETVRRDLGFCAPFILAQRIEQTARWYLEQGWL